MFTPLSKSLPLLALAAILLAAGALAGCGKSRDSGPPNVLLITLDSTRADRLGCYGYLDAASPSLDGLAGEGVLVERAISVAPLSLPAHASLLTGLYPPQHGVRDDQDARLADRATTLAEHLKAQGYATAAVVGTSLLSRGSGLEQGFDTYDGPARGMNPAQGAERPAEAVTDGALRLIAHDLKEPFFLWVQYHDPHAEHAAPPPIGALYKENPYIGEIAYTDQHVRRLFEDLRQRQLFDRTLVAVTGDHGDSLGEHGERSAGLYVYDSTLHVPLVLRLPGVLPPGRRIAGVVSGVDLAPTLLDLLHLPQMTGLAGVSFAGAARNEAAGVARDPVYAESELPLLSYGWSPLHALHDGRWKYIDAPTPELYDLASDPGELANLATSSPDSVRAWSERLEALRSTWSGDAAMDAESRERLASLGYVAAGGSAEVRPAGPDPKRGYLLHDALVQAQRLLSRGEPAPALELTEKVLAHDPHNKTALALAGRLRCVVADCAKGVELLRQAASLYPASHGVQCDLASVLHASGHLEEAAAAYRRALELQPQSGEARYGLGNVLYASGDVASALEQYREAIRSGLQSPALQAALGVALAASQDVDAARSAFEKSVELDPGFADGWNELGVLAEKAGDLAAARGRYEQALEARPGHRDALFGLVKVSLRLGEIPVAARSVEALLKFHPHDPAGRFLDAQVKLAQGDEAAARKALEAFLAQRNADARLVPTARNQLDRLDG